MRIGWVHYSMGSQSGVETVIYRSARGLLEADTGLRIHFVGRPGPLLPDWLALAPERVSFADVPEMGLNAWSDAPAHGRLALADKLGQRLGRELAGCETVVVENASVGAHPAFNLAMARLVESPPAGVARFVFRVHDLVFHRLANYEAVKALVAEAGLASTGARRVLFPDRSNTLHLTVNRTEAFALFVAGLDRNRIRYLPNAVDEALAGGERLAGELRVRLEAKRWAKPGEKLIEDKTEESAQRTVRSGTIKGPNGKYERALLEITDKTQSNARWAFGIRYANQKAYQKYRPQYLKFKASLKQYADVDVQTSFYRHGRSASTQS